MNDARNVAPPPDEYADDDEIRRYGALLDQINVGLCVFSDNGSPCLENSVAKRLLGDSPPRWLDEDGQTIPPDRLPAKRIYAGQPVVLDETVALSWDDGLTVWLNVNAMPVFERDRKLRRVLVTLTDISQQKFMESRIERLSVHDAVTGVFNKRHILALLDAELHRARRYGTPFTLAQLDIDHFHTLSSSHGRTLGDDLLIEVGKLIVASLREIDLTGRTGEGQFLLVLPNVSLHLAMVGLERLRAQIETSVFTDAKLRITVSGGITEYTGENADALLERCGSLLEHARELGRNRLCLDVDIL